MVEEYKKKPEGYQKGAKVSYQGSIFEAAFWSGDAPGVGDSDHNGWRLAGESVSKTGNAGSSKVIGYLPSWNDAFRQMHTYKRVTHIIVAFLSLTNDGKFTQETQSQVTSILKPVVEACHASGTKCMVAIGGAIDRGFKNTMTSVGNNKSSPVLADLVKQINDFVSQHDLDGVDLDLESWWPDEGSSAQDEGGKKSGTPHPAGKGLTLLAEALRRQFGNKKIISAAIPATSWYGNNFEGKELAKHVDWLGLMSYDLTGSWNESPVGPHAALRRIDRQKMNKYLEEQQSDWDSERYPIQSVEESVWFWSNKFFMDWLGPGQKVPREKIVIGVPVYGYDFAHDKGPRKTGYNTLTYAEIAAKFPKELSEQQKSDEPNIKIKGNAKRPYFAKKGGDYQYQNNIYFDTPHTAVQKLKYARDVGAAGVMVWETSNDTKEDSLSILQALYQNSGNPAKGDFPVPDSMKAANSLREVATKKPQVVEKVVQTFGYDGTMSILSDFQALAVSLKQLTKFDLEDWKWKNIEDILEVDQVAGKLTALADAIGKADVGMSAAGTAGTVLTILGFLFAPFSGGASLGLSFAGMAISIPAGVGGFTAAMAKLQIEADTLSALQKRVDEQYKRNKALVDILKNVSEPLENIDKKILAAKTKAEKEKDGLEILEDNWMLLINLPEAAYEINKIAQYFYEQHKLGKSFSDAAKRAGDVLVEKPSLNSDWMSKAGKLEKVKGLGKLAKAPFKGLFAAAELGLTIYDLVQGVKDLNKGSEKARELQKNAQELFDQHVLFEDMAEEYLHLA